MLNLKNSNAFMLNFMTHHIACMICIQYVILKITLMLLVQY